MRTLERTVTPSTVSRPKQAICDSSSLFRGLGLTIGLIVPFISMWIAYQDSIGFMVKAWLGDETYGHALFVPIIVAYLIVLKRDELRVIDLRPSWWGLPILCAGAALYAVGELATVYIVLHVSLWLVLVGLVVSAFGISLAAVLMFPLLYLLTMIPLPQFLYQGLSSQLQLLSSALGVGCLQIVGITAFREGNIIDLGPIQLQVIDACSGLRYLFPLASLSLLCAYLYKAALWKRTLLFVSTIPIAILLNGFRIGMIGVLVEVYGEVAAQGFYHFFEGWIFFVISLGILLGEIWLLAKLEDKPQSFGRLLAVFPTRSEIPPLSTKRHCTRFRLSPPYVVSVLLISLLALWSSQIAAHSEMPPVRETFLEFPMHLGGWHGSTFPLEQGYVDRLRFHDYLLADYRFNHEVPITLYMAYYESQKKGQSTHSHKTCIPGGGWEIGSFQTISLRRDTPTEGPEVNRVLIQKGRERQLVYYWFKQRDRQLTNEYLVKLYIFWDALTRQRTDGALIRLTTDLAQSESEAAADGRLTDFIALINPELPRYIPD